MIVMAYSKTKKTKKPKIQHPVCIQCEHYYITWDQYFPHGCRAMAFKSRKRPSIEVYESSGIICQMFSPKRQPKKK